MPGIEICRAFFFIHTKKNYFRSNVSEEESRMKNIYLAYFLIIMLSACGGKSSDTVSLSGEIKGLGNDTLYIYGADEMYDRMDTLPEGEKSEENVLRVRKEFIPYYDAHNADKSRPYPGIPELLEQLQSQGLQIAVASNKYQSATQKLIAHYFPKINFVAVFGQREGVNVKPDPTIVDDILSIAKTDRKDVLYVGDSGVDMQTAINAGVTSCGVTWGFRPRTELEEFHPDYIADKAEEILKRIN